MKSGIAPSSYTVETLAELNSFLAGLPKEERLFGLSKSIEDAPVTRREGSGASPRAKIEHPISLVASAPTIPFFLPA